MLRKLMKYEFKATARWFIPLYIAIVLFALINKVLFQNQMSEGSSVLSSVLGIVTFISMLIYILLFIGTMIISLVVVIQRFYKSLLGDEGYLMFTLPAKTWQHISNKLITATFWNILSGIIALGSIIILIPTEEISKIADIMSMAVGYIGPKWIILIAFLILINIVRTIIEIYLAIAFGHLFNKNRILLSFAIYLGINTVSQIVYFMVLPLIARPFMKFVISVDSMPDFSLTDGLQFFSNVDSQLTLFTVFILVASAVLSAGYFLVTNYLLKSRLNLE